MSRLRVDEALASVSNWDWRAPADPQKIIAPKIESIRFRLAGSLIRQFQSARMSAAVVGGNWDLHRMPIEQSPKIRAVIQHFQDDMEWEETDLFVRNYAGRFARGESYRGCSSVAELKESYRKEVDPIFLSMKKNGFVLPGDRGLKSNADLARVYISRNGEVLFGNGGNHRLAMAMLLGIETFPCIVSVRHADWQCLRDQVFAEEPDRLQYLGADLAEHPDMMDLIAPERATSQPSGGNGV